MNNPMRTATKVTTCLAALWLVACAPLPSATRPGARGIDGKACVGEVPAALAGLSPADVPAMLAQARYPAGQGGVCSARGFNTAGSGTRVYRVYDQRFPMSAYGKWWALALPTGPREAYRAANAICAEWSQLDRLVSCQLKAGAPLVLGTTQSVSCADGTHYPPTAELQVYLLSAPEQGGLNLENCQELGAWPPPTQP
jgi:hypothetical protein